MSTTIASMRVALSLDDSKFAGGLKRSLAGLKRFGIAAGVGAAAVGAILAKGLAANDELHKMSMRTDAATDALSALGVMAAMSDVTMTQLGTGLGRLQRTLGDAALGVKAPVQAFKDLMLNVDALRKLEPQQQLAMVADALNKIPDPAKRAALAYDIFGKGAEQMKPLLAQGSVEMQKQADELQALGVVMDDFGVQASARALDAITKLQAVGSSFVQVFAGQAAPEIESFVNGALKLMPKAIDAVTSAWRASIRAVVEWAMIVRQLGSGNFAGAFVGLRDFRSTVAGSFNETSAGGSGPGPSFTVSDSQRAALGPGAAVDTPAAVATAENGGVMIELLRNINGNIVDLKGVRAQ